MQINALLKFFFYILPGGFASGLFQQDIHPVCKLDFFSEQLKCIIFVTESKKTQKLIEIFIIRND